MNVGELLDSLVSSLESADDLNRNEYSIHWSQDVDVESGYLSTDVDTVLSLFSEGTETNAGESVPGVEAVLTELRQNGMIVAAISWNEGGEDETSKLHVELFLKGGFHLSWVGGYD